MWCQYFFIFLLLSFFSYTENALKTLLETHAIAGGSYAFVNDEKMDIVSEGTISLQSVVPVNQHTLFRIGSLTDLFTSHILAQLVLEGRLQLTDPVSKYVSRRQSIPQFGKREITLLDLATHTSGLPRNAFAIHQVSLLQSRALYSFLNNHTLENRPGEKREHAPVGYVLLNVVLNRASKEPVASLVEKIVCKKFGMEDTRYSLHRSLPQTVSFGHIQKALLSPKTQENRGSAFYDALGLYSSTHDMAKLLSFYLSEGIENGRIREILFQREDLPMGLAVRDVSRGAYEISSSQMGFSSYFTYDKTSKKGLVLLLNKEDVPIEKIGRALFTEL